MDVLLLRGYEFYTHNSIEGLEVETLHSQPVDKQVKFAFHLYSLDR